MARLRRAGRFVVAGLAVLAVAMVLAVLAVPPLVDFDGGKPRLEALASRALGMDVTLEGPLRASLFRGLHVGLGNVRIRNRGVELAFVEEVDIAIEFLPLLAGRLRPGGITLDRARITIERDRDARYNFQKPPGITGEFQALDLPRLSLPRLSLVYTDRLTGDRFESGNCTGELANLRHPGGAPFLTRLSVTGQFSCGEVRGAERTVSDLVVPVAATDGVFDFGPFTMRALGGRGSGSLHMDRSAPVPAVELAFTLAKFRVADVLKALPPGTSVSGLMDFSTTLAMRGRTRRELRRSARGEMALYGRDLTLAGVDLDRRYAKYEETQNFSLVDVAALVLAGPVGLVVTKGYDFSGAVAQSGGSTRIPLVQSRWRVEKGVAHAEDVALTTDENRLAVQGGLDFVDGEFDGVVVALVDANGCAKVRQRVGGPFGKPVVEKVGWVTALAGPMRSLLDRASDLLSKTGVGCEVFYAGSVAPPK
jgi:AsmA protein